MDAQTISQATNMMERSPSDLTAQAQVLLYLMVLLAICGAVLVA